MSYYLTFFLITNFIRQEKQLLDFINGFFLLGTIVALAMTVQFLIGSSIKILPGRVQDLSAEGTNLVNILRIAPPGLSVILVSFFALICIAIIRRTSAAFFPFELFQICAMGLSILLTFLRSIWASVLLTFPFLFFQVRRKERQKMIQWGIAFLFILLIVLLAIYINPDSRVARLVSATADRFATLINRGTFQGQDNSFEWRMLENKYAFASIKKHPLIGIGLGAKYRPYDWRLTVYGDPYDYRIHIHNGYLWILLDMGITGFITFMWLSFIFLKRGFNHWHNSSTDKLKGVMLGFTLVFLAVLISSVANSTFIQVRWTPILGIIMGVNEVIIRMAKAPKQLKV